MVQYTGLPEYQQGLTVIEGGWLSPDNPASRYELFLAPGHAEYSSYGGDKVTVDMRVQLLDKSNGSKLIWWGDISFFHNHKITLDEKVADNFAKSILERLVADGIVKLDTEAIRMPEEKAK